MAKPIIGINCDLKDPDKPKPYLQLYADYFNAIAITGGIPLLIPPLEDAADVEEALTTFDGLLLTGGEDLDPSLYGAPLHPATEEAPRRRQRFDIRLARAALGRRIPVLAICMGMQLVNVAAGGTLLQDIESESPGCLKHRQLEKVGEVHEVSISADSHLARIVGEEPLGVNSTHHQAIDAPAPGFRVCARAPDGVIEAIEQPAAPLVLGVQWHPERMLQHARHRSLFRALVEGAQP